MSLRLWLPLLRNAANAGNSLATITEQNIVYSSDGAKFKDIGTDSYIVIRDNGLTEDSLPNGFTISFSVKLTTTSGNQCVVCQRTTTGAGVAVFFIGNKLRFDVGNSSYTAAPTFNTNQWYHIVLSYRVGLSATADINNRQIYVDGIPAAASTVAGVLNSTFSDATYMMIGGSSNATAQTVAVPNNNARFYLKDFRFYDEIIPLVHYPMIDYEYFGTNNIWGVPVLTAFTASDTPGWDVNNHLGAMLSSIGGSGYNGGVPNPSTGYHACWVLEDGIPTIKFQDLNTTHRWLGISKTGIAAAQFENKAYTVSFDAKATVDGMLITGGLHYCLNGSTTYGFNNGQMSIPVTTVWRRYSYTWPAITNINTAQTARFYFYGHNTPNLQGTSYVRNIQLEINPGPTAYTKTERSSTTIPNTSPFNFPLTTVGSVSGNDDFVGYNFNGSSALSCASGLSLDGKNKTVSFWIKTPGSTFPSGSSVIFTDASSKIGCGFYNNGYFIVGSANNSQPVFNSNGYYKPGEWNHICISYYENDAIHCFLNGQSLPTTGSNNYWSASGGLTIGARKNSSIQSYIIGSIKEFKIFDYQFPTYFKDQEKMFAAENAVASIDENGRVYCNNFIENSQIQFKQNGIIHSTSFEEVPLQGMKITTFGDALWARIYWIDLSTEKTLFNATTAYDCNASNRFSKMKYVDRFINNDQRYEFLLRYPQLSSTAYNRWVQTASPSTPATSSNVAGYNPVGTLAWTTKFGHGIRLTSSTYTNSAIWTISDGNNWWSPIGQRNLYNNGMPAADGSVQLETELWVRIDNLPQARLSKDNKSMTGFEFIEQ